MLHGPDRTVNLSYDELVNGSLRIFNDKKT